MLVSLAFIPVADVSRAYTTLRVACPAALHPVYDFFRKNYIQGTPARGNRRAVPPRFPPQLWHNRFRQVVGKDYPDLYSAIIEFHNEQGYVEICIQELALGKKVK